MASCNVCCETFNKSTRREIPCATCDFKLCVACFEHYQSENSGLHEVSCMNCKQLWEDQYIHDHIPAAVLKRLSVATKKRLREAETAFMPETQLYVEYGRKVETVKVDEYLELVRQQNELLFQMAKNEMMVHKMDSKMTLKLQLKKLKIDANLIQTSIYSWRQQKRLCRSFRDIIPEALFTKTFPVSGTLHETVAEPKQSSVLCPCPGENCRGFVMRTEHKCGVCKVTVCGKCLSISNESHECNTDDIQTAKLVLSSSKPCPKCAVRIHKIEGCDQMWCTQCNTPFSWRTGQAIVGSTIHNPHYYEWIQRHRTHPLDYDHCEGLPDIMHVSQHVQVVFRNNNPFWKRVCEVHRQCVHYRHVDRPQEETDFQLFFKNIDIRMRWLENDITDKKFESSLHRRYKQKLVQQRVTQVYDLIVTLCSDVFHRLLRENTNTSDVIEGFLTEFQEIYNYANSRFEKLEKVYKVKLVRV